jgi:hypothetical protein
MKKLDFSKYDIKFRDKNEKNGTRRCDFPDKSVLPDF